MTGKTLILLIPLVLTAIDGKSSNEDIKAKTKILEQQYQESIRRTDSLRALVKVEQAQFLYHFRKNGQK